MVQGPFVRLLAPHPFVNGTGVYCERNRRFESLFLRQRIRVFPKNITAIGGELRTSRLSSVQSCAELPAERRSAERLHAPDV
jgi:hypothetical protein